MPPSTLILESAGPRRTILPQSQLFLALLDDTAYFFNTPYFLTD